MNYIEGNHINFLLLCDPWLDIVGHLQLLVLNRHETISENRLPTKDCDIVVQIKNSLQYEWLNCTVIVQGWNTSKLWLA